MRVALRAAMAALLLLVAGACVPSEDKERITEFEPETIMGEIQADGEMLVGIDPVPPFGNVDEDPSGFSVEMAEVVAGRLGVDVSYVAAPSHELFEKLIVDPETEESELLLAFPSVPLTESRARTNTFANPFFVSHQRLLVRREGPAPTDVDDVPDLAGETVCAVLDEPTAVDLTEIEPEVEIVEDDIAGCGRRLENGEVAAVTGQDIELTALLADAPEGSLELTGEDLNTVGYAPAVRRGAKSWADFVTRTLAEAEGDGRWSSAYTRSIGTLLGPLPDPPELTWGEAASFYPRELEEAQAND